MNGDEVDEVPVPHEYWAGAILRSYKMARESADTEAKRRSQVPISPYEPCERCGVLVITLVQNGATSVVEVSSATMKSIWCPFGEFEFREDGTVRGRVRLETAKHTCREVSRDEALADFQRLLARATS